MLKLKLSSCAGLLLAVFLFAAPGFSAASELKSFAGPDASAELGTFYLVNTSPERISALNRGIQAEVEAGKITLDKGEQAQNIWVSLQQYLANQSAEIHRIENKIMKSADNAQLKAIRDLARSAVEQERVLISVYLVLQKIANDEGFDGEELISDQKQKDTVRKESASGKSTVEIEFSSTDALIKDLE